MKQLLLLLLLLLLSLLLSLLLFITPWQNFDNKVTFFFLYKQFYKNEFVFLLRFKNIGRARKGLSLYDTKKRQTKFNFLHI